MHDTKNQKTADSKIDEIINRRMKNLFISLLATATIEQIEEDENGWYVKMSYEHDGEPYTNINCIKAIKDLLKVKQKKSKLMIYTLI